MLAVDMKPANCSNNNSYIHDYKTTNWFWNPYSCKFTPMYRALEAFCWLGLATLPGTIVLAFRDMQDRRNAQISADSEAPRYPALPSDRKPKVEEVVEVVQA